MKKQSVHTLEPVKKKTRLYEDVVQQIVGKIENGTLKAGDRLPTERDLVVQLGVSRTSVREALRALELMGMIESRVKEGTFVKDVNLDVAMLKFANRGALDGKRILEMYQVRAQLEVLSIRLAAQNRTEKHLDVLRKAVLAMQDENGRGKRGLTADKHFHRTVAEAAGNGVLTGMLSMFSDLLTSSIAASNSHANVNVLVREHQEMYEAIENRDEKLAERLIRKHIGRAYDRMKFINEHERAAD